MGHIPQAYSCVVPVSGKKVKAFPIRSGIRHKCRLLPHLLDRAWEGSAREMIQDEETKIILIIKK